MPTKKTKNPTSSKPTRKPRKTKSQRISTSSSFDVLALRKAIGKANGVKAISRNVLAKLIGASAGSIYNWEHGTTAPAARFLTKLKDLANGATMLRVEPPKRGRPTGSGRRAAAKGRRGRPVAIHGDVPILYANQVVVLNGGTVTRIRFGLALPGEKGARTVADVVMPEEGLRGLGRLGR